MFFLSIFSNALKLDITTTTRLFLERQLSGSSSGFRWFGRGPAIKPKQQTRPRSHRTLLDILGRNYSCWTSDLTDKYLSGLERDLGSLEAKNI